MYPTEYNAPTFAPILVPTIKSISILSESIISRTGMWAYPFAAPPDKTRATLGLLEIIVPIISRTPLIKIGLQSAYSTSIKADKELLKIIVKPALRRTAPKVLRAMCIGMSVRSEKITAPYLLQKLNKLSTPIPTLLIWGRNDKLVPLKIGEYIAKISPSIRLFVLNGSGHCPHDESPNEFNTCVLNWIKTNLETN